MKVLTFELQVEVDPSQEKVAKEYYTKAVQRAQTDFNNSVKSKGFHEPTPASSEDKTNEPASK